MSRRGSVGRTDVRRNRRRHRYMMLLTKRLVVEPFMSSSTAPQTIHKLQMTMAVDGRWRMLLKKPLVVSISAAQPIPTLQMKLENVLCKVAVVYSNDSNMQQEAIILIRKLLCLEGSGLPIEKVVHCCLVPAFLTREDWIQIQIATGGKMTSNLFLDHVAAPSIVSTLATLQCEIGRDRIVSWLGDHVGLYRDRIISHTSLLKKDAQLSMLRNDTLALLNFCQSKPTFDLLLTKEAVFGVLEGLLVDSSDEEVLTNTCCALLYLSADANEIQALIEAGFCQRLVHLIQHPSPCVVIPALLTVANIVTHIDVLIHQVIKAGLIAPLVKEVEKEFGLAISKANKEEIKLLVKRGCIKPLCDLLSSRDPTVVSVCLQGLEKVGEALEDNNFAHLIDEAGGFDKIENLQSHHNHEISLKAVKIVKASIRAVMTLVNLNLTLMSL